MELKDIGEFSFIDAINENVICNPTNVVVGIGDDCAVYRPTLNWEQLITIDTMVEDVHFSFQYMNPFDIGYRLCTANFSDIAAMGGTPRQIVLSVAAPRTTGVAVLIDIYKGIKEQCKKFNVNIIGGDTVSTDGPMVLTVTVVGEVEQGTAVLRSGAKPGQLVGVTNYIGYAATGLDALTYDLPDYTMTKIGHCRPEPQIELGQWLHNIGATSMNDISDGLSSELHEIAKASNVDIIIDEQAIPLHEETYALAEFTNVRPVDYALYGGEDFQLVFTIPSHLEHIVKIHGGITIIGQVIAGDGKVQMVTSNRHVETIEGKGFNHFGN